MSVNLVSLVQQNLGYPELLKMDANTQEAVIDTALPAEDRFSQAAIPAVLITIYKYSRSDEMAEKLLKDEQVVSWMSEMQKNAPGEMIQVVADYAGIPLEESSNRMNAIAAESVRLIKQDIGEKGTILDLKNLMANQRNFILPYLPASMQLGTMLDDSTLDDRTNKMQGPVSGLMHVIGNKLAGSDTSSAI
ncbi:MAG: hypothetical protein IPG86_19525 [Chitinophagaceae bacterium]|nr:hypothetical protein [Chitinophagaceae bacterium]